MPFYIIKKGNPDIDKLTNIGSSSGTEHSLRALCISRDGQEKCWAVCEGEWHELDSYEEALKMIQEEKLEGAATIMECSREEGSLWIEHVVPNHA